MIKMVSVVTDQGTCFVNVEQMPSFLRVSCSRELIEGSDPEALADVIARAMIAAFEIGDGEMKPIKNPPAIKTSPDRVTLKRQPKGTDSKAADEPEADGS
jgi:DNA-binding protein YbaB